MLKKVFIVASAFSALLVGLKLGGAVALPWWAVFAPLWLTTLAVLVTVGALTICAISVLFEASP